MVEALEVLVKTESPTSDPAATAACVDVTNELAERLLGESGEVVTAGGRKHLRWSFGSRRDVVLIGHLDTVWPLGTIDSMPFEVKGDRISGPGIFDMKGGVVQLLFALSALDDLAGVGVLLTSDEEIGSPTSEDLIVETCTGAKAALVLEPSANGAVKIARKGVTAYRVEVLGRSAHAGLEPENGVNATVELAHQVLAIQDLARGGVGTTVTPTMISAGTSSNSVPGRGSLLVDVRCATVEEAERVERGLRRLGPSLPGATITIEVIASSHPFPLEASKELFARAQRLAAEVGMDELKGVTVGGGSDGNRTASIGVPTLDGLGAVGGGAHADDEHVIASAMPERAALVAALVNELLNEDRAG